MAAGRNISEKALQRISECLEKQLPYLNLSNCGLREIPMEIFEFDWLKSLNLGNIESNDESTNSENIPNYYAEFYAKPLPNLRILIMANCGLFDVEFISNFLFLKELYLSNNDISDIKPLRYVINNKKLKILDLSKNPISDISPIYNEGMLGTLIENKELLELNLEKTKIPTFRFLEFFSELISLNIDANLPTIGAYDLKGFTKLTNLRLSAQELIGFENFEGLKSLESLILTFEKGDISFVKNLTNLTNLTIKSSKIDDLTGFDALINLKELNLSNNLISDITPLRKLENLEILNLENNQIVDIKPLIALKKLNSINISNNKIQFIEPLIQLERQNVLSPELLKLNTELGIESSGLQAINVDISISINENPIEDFPANRLPTLQFLRDVKNFFVEDTNCRTIPCREIKLILVGNSASGKTNLANILRGGRFNNNENTTHGVIVKRHKIGDLFVSFWDFGGQEYYHGTHRLFFSNNAVYVLLWNKNTNGYDKKPTKLNRKKAKESLKKDEIVEHFHYDYWLDTVRAFAPINDKKRSDLLIVQTHIDEENNQKQNVEIATIQRYKIDFDYYLSLKPAKKGISRFKYGLATFKEELLETLKSNIEKGFLTPTENTIREWFIELSQPKTTTLNPLKNSVKYSCFINFGDFEKECIKHFNTIPLTRSQLETLVGTLHDAGLVLYYRNNAILRQKIYFAPQLITTMMYDVLDEEIVLKNNGAFTPAHTIKMLKGNAELAQDLERLMIEFGVILPFPSKGEYTHFITPQYLPEKHDVSGIFSIATAGFGEKEITLKLPIFYYRNAMMHLLNLYATASSGRIFWKNGILFTQNDARIFIRGELNTTTKETNEALITIAVAASSEGNQRAKQIEILREIFKSMNPQSRILGYDYVLSAYDFLDEFKDKLSVAMGNNKTDFVPILELKKQANAGLIMTFWNNKRQNIRAFDVVLEAINVKKPTPSVFISYSHSDIKERDELCTYLGVIERKQGIKIWTDGNIDAGTEWNAEIKAQLNSADVIVLLVSAHFLKSNFIYDNELMPALQKIKDDATKRVIPVLIKTTPKLPELWALQFLPQNEFQRLQAVNSWNYKDDAWTQIAEAIGKAFEQ